jgi:hypothetical protein
MPLLRESSTKVAKVEKQQGGAAVRQGRKVSKAATMVEQQHQGRACNKVEIVATTRWSL